ncbi:hypothetical protein [Parasporobacterium paucivorans]|uniref:Uncharacterized protein n=1 Tax=Parasporobacterium paucivorans DSM 15970 TaxID=1122934 RepID=A0A1M6FVW4_9FIRM|nr:hypothetical protein [Parasporobacterium paucivorans]SHJ01797.1 hypothetical protein SAMN02745691_01215 [Parasporobacterium paucivorans DSM 15970]
MDLIIKKYSEIIIMIIAVLMCAGLIVPMTARVKSMTQLQVEAVNAADFGQE